ncbi:MAG TPA: cytochrome c3 family protein [Syntrophorhabdaceae bacterium]|nr:cytochrome c3 family protein [Syntrophorhabdaceae bacterium]
MKGLVFNKTAILLCVTLLFILGIVTIIMAAPQRRVDAKPGNCMECHGSEKVLSTGHPETTNMNLKECLSCHTEKGKESLRGKITGSHTHGLAGITCDGCHGKKDKYEALEFDRCLKCHDVDRLVEKTSKIKPTNPHTSPHYGKDLDCNLCHRQHARSENYCNQCHDFKFIVP